MKTPRFAISTLLVIVGVIAADLVIWRDECYTLLPPVDSKQPFMWVIIPMMDALVVVGCVLTSQVIRRGEGHAFLLGFELTGCVLALILIAAYWARGGPIDACLQVTKNGIDWLLRRSGLVTHIGDYYTPFSHDFATPTLVCAVISLPSFLVAISGGWLFAKLEITIVRRRGAAATVSERLPPENSAFPLAGGTASD